jgi:hypothetical protein
MYQVKITLFYLPGVPRKWDEEESGYVECAGKLFADNTIFRW